MKEWGMWIGYDEAQIAGWEIVPLLVRIIGREEIQRKRLEIDGEEEEQKQGIDGGLGEMIRGRLNGIETDSRRDKVVPASSNGSPLENRKTAEEHIRDTDYTLKGEIDASRLQCDQDLTIEETDVEEPIMYILEHANPRELYISLNENYAELSRPQQLYTMLLLSITIPKITSKQMQQFEQTLFDKYLALLEDTEDVASVTRVYLRLTEAFSTHALRHAFHLQTLHHFPGVYDAAPNYPLDFSYILQNAQPGAVEYLTRNPPINCAPFSPAYMRKLLLPYAEISMIMMGPALHPGSAKDMRDIVQSIARHAHDSKSAKALECVLTQKVLGVENFAEMFSSDQVMLIAGRDFLAIELSLQARGALGGYLIGLLKQWWLSGLSEATWISRFLALSCRFSGEAGEQFIQACSYYNHVLNLLYMAIQKRVSMSWLGELESGFLGDLTNACKTASRRASECHEFYVWSVEQGISRVRDALKKMHAGLDY